MGSSTILIAPAAAIGPLQAQPSLRGSRAFLDTEIDSALRAIQESVPQVIAVERNFAMSLEGQGFVRRIKTDPKLRQCDVQTVGIRRAERYTLSEGLEVQVDEHPASLVDISTTGALVVSASSLRPRQRIRVVLRSGQRPLTALVVWVHFELPHEGPRYRAGIEFVSSASETVEGFISEIRH